MKRPDWDSDDESFELSTGHSAESDDRLAENRLRQSVLSTLTNIMEWARESQKSKKDCEPLWGFMYGCLIPKHDEEAGIKTMRDVLKNFTATCFYWMRHNDNDVLLIHYIEDIDQHMKQIIRQIPPTEMAKSWTVCRMASDRLGSGRLCSLPASRDVTDSMID